MIFPAVRTKNGIDYNIIMQMSPVKVGAYDRLEPVSEASLGKLDADVMRLFRRYLNRDEGLDKVITENTALFIPSLFCSHHFTVGGFRKMTVADSKSRVFVLIGLTAYSIAPFSPVFFSFTA